MKPIRFSPHAQAKLSSRGIELADVEQIVHDPAVTLPTRGLRQHVIGYVGSRGLHVVYEETDQEIWVVTAYWVLS